MTSFWGIGSFENDSARDFVGEVVQDGVVALQEAFEVVLDPDLDDLEAEEACRALAAAEIVAAGVTGQTQSLTDAALRVWLAQVSSAQLSALMPLGAQAIAQILTSESGMTDAWSDPVQAEAWHQAVRRLHTQLQCPA